MKKIFADTSYWISILHKEDKNHNKFKDFSDEQHHFKIYTLYEVLSEFLTVCSFHPKHLKIGAAHAVDAIFNNQNVAVLGCDVALFKSSLEIYKLNERKMALTDFMIINTMKYNHIDTIMTVDNNFRDFDFNVVP
jgi:uncharacterized protein